MKGKHQQCWLKHTEINARTHAYTQNIRKVNCCVYTTQKNWRNCEKGNFKFIIIRIAYFVSLWNRFTILGRRSIVTYRSSITFCDVWFLFCKWVRWTDTFTIVITRSMDSLEYVVLYLPSGAFCTQLIISVDTGLNPVNNH